MSKREWGGYFIPLFFLFLPFPTSNPLCHLVISSSIGPFIIGLSTCFIWLGDSRRDLLCKSYERGTRPFPCSPLSRIGISGWKWQRSELGYVYGQGQALPQHTIRNNSTHTCKRHRKDHLNKQTNKNQLITALRVMEPLLSFLRDHASTCSVVSDVCVSVCCQTPLSRGFPRQGYWNGLSFPPPGNLPDPGIEPTSLVSLTL